MKYFAPKYTATLQWSQCFKAKLRECEAFFSHRCSNLRSQAQLPWIKDLFKTRPYVFTSSLGFASSLTLQTREKLHWVFWYVPVTLQRTCKLE